MSLRTIIHFRSQPLAVHILVNSHTQHIFETLFNTWQLPLGILLITVRKRSLQRLCFTPVCQSFCSRGGLPHCMLGYTPRTRGRYPPDQRQVPPSAVHAGRYGQQAGGMHSTGMQSCPFDKFYCYINIAVKLFTIKTVTG